RPPDGIEGGRPGQPDAVLPRPLGVVVDAGLAFYRWAVDAPRPVRSPQQLHAHRTSAMRIGGLWMWVIDGSGPTTSEAISSASRRVEAGLKPMRRTALGSPPTTITPPRCCRAWAPQYHM